MSYVEFFYVFSFIVFCLAYCLYKLTDDDRSVKNSDEFQNFNYSKQNQTEKLPQMPYETEKHKKKYVLDCAPKKIIQNFNQNITDEEYIISVKNDECLYLVYDFKADYLKKAFFNSKKYEYDVDEKDFIDKCILVGKNSNIKFYLNLSSFEKYDDSIRGKIHMFEYKKNQIPEDGSKNVIIEFWITFSKGEYNQIFLNNAWTHRGVYKEFLLKFDNGFLISLYYKLSALENYEITKAHWIKNLNELKKILIKPVPKQKPIQIIKPVKHKIFIQPKKIFTFFQYDVYELKRKLSDYNKREKTLWELGIEYERYIGYLWESQGYKVIYNGAVKGSADGGIDLIFISEFTTYVVQCKRWKKGSYINTEEIKKFHQNVKKFKKSNRELIGDNNLLAIFYSTTNFTADAKKFAKRYKIDCQVKEFNIVYEYPPVKCGKTYDGRKFYCLPFDEEFDKIQLHCDRGDCYKFTIDEAEKAGYQYLEYPSFYIT